MHPIQIPRFLTAPGSKHRLFVMFLGLIMLASATRALATDTIWFDDALPAGAGASGTWNWISSDPEPYSGALAHQTGLQEGLHGPMFNWATETLAIEFGDTLFTHVYMDPVNPPRQLMLSWRAGNWEHRAYWGESLIPYGTEGTASRRYMGPLPEAGAWVRLEVPANAVNLEGKLLYGMSFSLYDGRATWDLTGKSAGDSEPGEPDPGEPPPADFTVWFNDAPPDGAGLSGTWNWVNSDPTPFSGTLAHQTALSDGVHGPMFNWATATLAVGTGDSLVTHVYLDPEHTPRQIMLSWRAGNWEHRAYWGENLISYGTDGTASRLRMGPLPVAGEWVRLAVPAEMVNLEGTVLSGMSFTLYDGRATWDLTGKSTGEVDPGDPDEPGDPADGETTLPSDHTVWFNDAPPAGASTGGTWNWVSQTPTPFSGLLAHQTDLRDGVHGPMFNWASETLDVGLGETLFTHVYLDPDHPPRQIMLSWRAGNWEHRAYWGENLINHGTNGTPSRRHMGAMPATGEWIRLDVPAEAVNLEQASLYGMSFSLYDGRATWDLTGKHSGAPPTEPGDPEDPDEPDPPEEPASYVDYLDLRVPEPGDHMLRVLAPTLLELILVNTKERNPERVESWDWIDHNGVFSPPDTSSIAVSVDGVLVPVIGMGFKRRPLYASLYSWDPRISNHLYLELEYPIFEFASVEVTNDGTAWSPEMQFTTTMEPLRFNPAIHVNQEGYVPDFPKKAMIGYYLGDLGEMQIAPEHFHLVDAATGALVFEGSLEHRPDFGYTYTPTPYQEVYEADFSAFRETGDYVVMVPGMGASLPFPIHDGVAMNFARTYALGLYHQRSGFDVTMPYTRFTHAADHMDPAFIPVHNADPFVRTWEMIANHASRVNTNNPPQTAPRLTSPSEQLYPFVNDGETDAYGGHFEAGNYSRVTRNSAQVLHDLVFAVDSLPGVASLDNLGLPESGDGVSDLVQSAMWEADFLLRMQDADGGFYYSTYPINRAYENNVLPEDGDQEVVWPKNTVSTASAVAALAQIASSPHFKEHYPEKANTYLNSAKSGWAFLLDAIALHGKAGAYQRIMHFGDDFTHDDELAWAAAELYLATGKSEYQDKLFAWFPVPGASDTKRWGWWGMYGAWGNAIRSYAFAARSGRLTSGQLDPNYLVACENEILAVGNDNLGWSQDNAYGTSFPNPTKRVRGAGWYFSTVQAFNIVAAYQLDPNPAYLDAILLNMNYEGGANPVNAAYVTGMGWKRQRQIVDQYSINHHRTLPKTGIPIGNLQQGFPWTFTYENELTALAYPTDGAQTAPYPYYDRWADFWNVATESSSTDIARSLAGLAWLAAQTPMVDQPWHATVAEILVPEVANKNQPVTVTLHLAEMNPTGARIVWEARDQQPSFGWDNTYTFTPTHANPHWVEVEIQWPDGRRAFAKATVSVE